MPSSKTTVKTTPPRASKALNERLTHLLVDSLTAAAERLSGAKDKEFTLMPLNPVRVVIALSGGCDSMAMLDAAARFFHRPHQYLVSRMTAVYVNHGLSDNADDWQEHCRKECEKRKIDFQALSVYVNPHGKGVEAAAREVRYRALANYAVEHGDDLIVTAHHEDDRLETFLLQWLRGGGPEGLAAFPETRLLTSTGTIRRGHPTESVLLVRPWRNVLRQDLERYARSRRLKWVTDESNNDYKYARNRIRHEVMPIFEAIRPGFRHAAARSVELTAEAVDVLRSVAADDLERCRDPENPHQLRIIELLRLVPARQAWCLRHWMQLEGMAMPNRARLEDGLRQIRETHTDSQLTVRVRNKEMRRWGECLMIRDVPARTMAGPRDMVIDYKKPTVISLPNWAGELHIIPCRGDERGIDPERLRRGRFEVRLRRGGEKLKLWPLRPSKHLKDLFALAQVPSFERADLPLLWLDDSLIFVAGLGMEIRAADDPALVPERVRFEFHPDCGLWGSSVVENLAEVEPKPKARRRPRKKA